MKKVSNKILWIFAIGQLGWSMLAGIVTNWFVFFYQPTEEVIAKGHTYFVSQGPLFLGITILGLIAFVARIFDAITDPLVASMSDRAKFKKGRRIPFMKFIAIPFALMTVLLFCLPNQGVSMTNNILLLVFNLLFYLCMTIYCTPYNALIPELGNNQTLRTNVSTFISVTFILGTTISYLVPNIAQGFEASFGYTNSIRITVAIIAFFAVIFMLIPTFLIDEKTYVKEVSSESRVIESLKKTFSNSEFRKFVASDVLYFISITLFQTGLPFFITVLLGLDAGMTFILFALMTFVSLLFYPVVNIVSKKTGKKKLVIIAFIWFSVAFMITAFAGSLGISSLIWGVIIAISTAIPMAVLGILPQAIVADIAEADEVVTEENRNGMFFAARTFAFKMGQSLALLIFTSLAIIGTNGFGYRLAAIVACILCVSGAIILSRYNENKTLLTIEDGRARR